MSNDRVAEQIRLLHSTEGGEKLAHLYGNREGVLVEQIQRYSRLLKWHHELFPDAAEVRFFSAPGRTEIGGNHTDHNNGKVLAAAISLDTVAAVAPTADGIIQLCSEGYRPIRVDVGDLTARADEEGSTTALIRGIAARMRELGYQIGGFQAAVTSNVLRGSGLSSSAAFEVLIAAIFDGLYNGFKQPGVQRAQVAQWAENVYFNKPCGLMDQAASSLGGLVNIDFERAEPKVKALQYDFAAKGYALCVVNTGGNHGDLTADYAAIRSEMEAVAACFGQPVLRQVTLKQLEAELPELRTKVSDRALLRAWHYLDENARVDAQVGALEQDNLPEFLRLIIASGESSWKLLQNIYADPAHQQMALALEMSHRLLAGRGAWRVHGGGFAGTILAFVPNDLWQAYAARLDAVFGEGACTRLDIRPVGAAEIRV